MASCNPYLFFVGNCREAFTHYHEVLGGDLEIMDMGSVPAGERPPGMDPSSVMHAALMVDGALLMGSDDPTATERQPVSGAAVSFSTDSPEDVARIVGGLAEGGAVTVPVSPTFFSPAFGMLIDRFGVPWMVMAEAAEG